MRIAASVLVLLFASQAHAEKGLSLDFGYVRSRVSVTDQTAIGGESGRFGIRVSLARYFHFGAEAEEGVLAGTTSLPAGAVARTTGEPQGPLEGNTLALKAFAGAHARVGSLMFGGDLAVGVRDTWVSSDLGMDVAGRKDETLLELRTRADLWLTSTTTIGAVASTDLIEHRDVSLAAVFALHFTQ
jgi:hypothetical protein